VPEIKPDIGNATSGEGGAGKALNLDVALDAGMPVDLGTDLERLASRSQLAWTRMQHRPAVTQSRDTLPIEQVRIDARDLRCHISPKAHRAPGQLVDQFEGAQIEVMAGAGQQRLHVLEHRRDH